MAKRKRITNGDESALETEGAGPSTVKAEAPVQSLPKKRRTVAQGKKPASKPKGKGKGKSSKMLEMPYDVLCEIILQLRPEDLLALSRTSRGFREILLLKSNRFLWTTAFRDDPLFPHLPSDMNEPQFACLVFSNHCYYCLKATPDNQLMWAFRTRCCGSCLRTQFGPFNDVLRGVRSTITSDILLSSSVLGPKKKIVSVYKHSEARDIDILLKSFKPDSPTLAEFLQNRRKQVSQMLAGNYPITAALERRIQLAKMDKEKERAKCKEQIYKRLRDLGYAEELAYIRESDYSFLDNYPSISSRTELTDRVWNNIHRTLVDLLEDTRTKRRRKQRKTLLKARQRLLGELIKDHPSNAPARIKPGPADICAMPQIKQILVDTPVDEVVTAEHFQETIQGLEQLFAQWITDKSRELLKLLPNQPGAEDEVQDDTDFSRLELATTYFTCTRCVNPLSYPRILLHNCLTELPHGFRNREDDNAIMFLNVGSVPWNYNQLPIEYRQDAESAAKKVVTAFGFDFRTTTHADMRLDNRWMECRACRHPKEGRMVFRWEKAILHEIFHDLQGRKSHWIPLSDEDIEAAKRQESKGFPEHRDETAGYCCAHCDERGSFVEIRAHSRWEHAIQEFKETDYFRHPDASMDHPPFFVHIPVPPPVTIDLTDDEAPEHEIISIDD
ncbi:hypothetical protein CCMSSC00406_0005138 [Pleurotus cornucopiae]|uniref:Uncharacterized protein n=1 Tax=Pleurotus cornucopiae TaxID=5321 RepID=A0ACB7J6L9_PLECO|nr:hypothetical protein CCMSSC00406_0005138 [Pleurotus cornucopiae]